MVSHTSVFSQVPIRKETEGKEGKQKPCTLFSEGSRIIRRSMMMIANLTGHDSMPGTMARNSTVITDLILQ